MHDSKVLGMGHWGKNINVFWWSCLKTHKIWFGFTLEPWSNLWGWKSTFPDFAEAICVLLRLYAHHSLRLYSKCWGYMHFFAEAICILLRLYAGLCENIDHLSPVEAGAGTELGNKNIHVFMKLVKNSLIAFGFIPEPWFKLGA